MYVLVHTLYVGHRKFEKVIETLECDVEPFLLDPEIIADDYVLFIDKETKERTMLKVLASQFGDRRHLHEKIEVKSNDEALTYIIENRKEIEEKRIKYKIKTEKCMNIINIPTNLQDDELDEFTVVVVSGSGIYVELKNKNFSFPKTTVNIGQGIGDVVNDSRYETLSDGEELIPLMNYSNKMGNEIKRGRVYLIQSESATNSALSIITPAKTSKCMIAETFAFDDVFSRYLFWILENLYKHENLPELELGIKDEPQVLGEILNNRMRCLTDLTDIDYNNFAADNFMLYVQPYLTKSQQRERAMFISKNEKNYIEVMELIYEEPFLEWALEYDAERTKQDERYKRIYG